MRCFEIAGTFPFFGYASMILGLSLARLMPAAWTHYYDASAAWRRWAWIGFLPAFIGAFRNPCFAKLWEEHREARNFQSLPSFMWRLG